MEQGYDVIYQGSLIDDEWAGFSDFLVKVDTPSAKWPWSYEVLDTKLKRKEDVSQHLQLVVYSNMIADIQGVYPKQGHIYLGNDTMATVEMSEICEDAEKVMNELKEFIESGEQAPQRNVLHVRCAHIVAIAKQNGRQRTFISGGGH